MKIIFFDVMPYHLAEIYRLFEGAYCLHLQFLHPEDGGSTFLHSVGIILPNYVATHPRKRYSSKL